MVVVVAATTVYIHRAWIGAWHDGSRGSFSAGAGVLAGADMGAA